MALMNYPIPSLDKLPKTMPQDGSISMVLQNGIPIFRASQSVIDRISELLDKQKNGILSKDEEADLDQYELVDDYLSHINRLVRNLSQSTEN